MLSLVAKFLPTFLPAFQLLTNPVMLATFLIYSIVLSGFFAFQGWQVGMNKHLTYLAEQSRETVKFITKVVTLRDTIRVPYLQTEYKIHTEYVYLDKEAEDVPNRDSCNVTAGWMRVHNAAAQGPDRRVNGAVDDPADTGITESSALQTIIGNYKSYHQVANDLQACRGFLNGLNALTK